MTQIDSENSDEQSIAPKSRIGSFLMVSLLAATSVNRGVRRYGGAVDVALNIRKTYNLRNVYAACEKLNLSTKRTSKCYAALC